VAGFIGSPPMNMAVGRIVREGDDLAVRLGSATIRLHPAVAAQRPALAAYVARDVTVAIRSEDVEDARLVRGAPADTRALEKDAHTEDVPTHVEGPSSWPPSPRLEPDDGSGAPGSHLAAQRPVVWGLGP
jgi:multiple sugar transport system ATP-binding protein